MSNKDVVFIYYYIAARLVVQILCQSNYFVGNQEYLNLHDNA